jgi:RHS repeat-associated protein
MKKPQPRTTPITATELSLPKGGGAIQGLGETFQANEFTGTATISVPLPTSPCRGCEPQLSLTYSSGAGNGVFGLGFALGIPSVARKTSRGLPRYDDSDTFLVSSAEDLVPMPDGQREERIGTVSYTVRTYRPRTEGPFAQIEHWVNPAQGDSHWQVVDRANVTSRFGTTADTRVSHPDHPAQIFQWLLADTFDARGNHGVYEYVSENSVNVSAGRSETNRVRTANKYPKRIRYGNRQPFQGDQDPQGEWHFEVVFDYGEHDLDPGNATPYTPVHEWAGRKDPFSTYQAGFELRTHRLCRHVLMFHRFVEEFGPEPVLVHATRLRYQELPTGTLLTAVESVGYRHRPGQPYAVRSLPPLEFRYTAFQPLDHAFEPLLQANGQDLPGPTRTPGSMLIDLYGEGIPGLLYSDGDTTLYWEPQSQEDGAVRATTVRYAAPQAPLAFPIERRVEGYQHRLMDMTGSGRLDLVVSTLARTGYYEANPDRSWQSFQTLAALPTDFHDPASYLVDVTGDGLADIVRLEHDQIRVYPSRGASGFGPAYVCERPVDLPLPRPGARNEVVQFVDLFGTGTAHLVRITNGMVECWPSLGYGRFGQRVLMDDAPRVDEPLDASRLFLADLDGSGTPDLIYAHADHVEIFFNQSGNGFSAPVTIPLPAPWDRLDQLDFADVYGNGTACLVLGTTHPERRRWCYDFTQGTKPYLLREIDNNLGARSTLTYRSATHFYLADKQQGHPWIVSLPFPVHVVAKRESLDLITQTKLTSSYAYHHGYYDGVEREFRGFGMVERLDAETRGTGGQASAVPPVLTKTWYHTGAWTEADTLSRHYAGEYFRGDPDAYQMPDSVFDCSAYQQQHPGYAPDAVARREACRTLKGKVLREEVYGLDGSGLEPDPYTVTESNYCVRLLQPPGPHAWGVYAVTPRESLAYHYERDPHDPRIQHDVVLEITPFGEVTRACSVAYGRRPSASPAVVVHPEQAALKATVQLARFIEVQAPFRLIGTPFEQQTFELSGLDLRGQPYFQLAEIRQQVEEALQHRVPYGVPFGPDIRQARLFSWQQSYFWNQSQDEALPLGQATAPALLHHQRHAVFSDEWLQAVYGDRLDRTLIGHEGGYFREDDGYWWNKGLVQHYFSPGEPEAFYLPWKTENGHGGQATPPHADGLLARTIVTYDPYFLEPVSTEAYFTETDKNVITALIDYQTMSPWQLTDVNQVQHQVLFDPLGMVVGTSIFKEATGTAPRAGDGDLSRHTVPSVPAEASLARTLADDPATYLGDATSVFYYDTAAWPATAVSIVRQTHVSDLSPGQPSMPQVAVSYMDGFGRTTEDKRLVEPGEAIQHDDAGKLRHDAQGRPVRGRTSKRWLVSGLTVYNNKGQPALQYLPYFSDTPSYEAQGDVIDAGLLPPPTRLHYDPLLRPIRTDTPKGFFSKVEFTPWESRHHDENDTVKDAPYYAQASPEVKQTLDRTAGYGTPHVTVLDSLGHPFLQIEDNLGAVSADTFGDLVTAPLSSREVWETLIARGYLVRQDVQTDSAWISSAFQPYGRGFRETFVAALGERYRLVAEAVLARLRQQCLASYYRHDIQGRQLEAVDPRLFHANSTTGTAYYSFRYHHAMGGDATSAAATDSADAGHTLTLDNIFGSHVWNLSPRGFEQVITYDRLQRKRQVRVKGFKHDGTLATDNVVETYTYGETQPEAAAANLRGELYELRDQSGVVVNSRYSLQRQVLETERQFALDYKDYLDWQHPVALETTSDGQPLRYRTRLTVNALQQVLAETTPDGSTTTRTYNQDGLLETIAVTFADGTRQPIVDGIDYDANRQRLAVSTASGVQTTYTYEDTTLRLLTLQSARPGHDAAGKARSPLLQDIAYTYDPVGNITTVSDRTYQTVFHDNQMVEPRSAYTYDALYHLVAATGRQHPGIAAAGDRPRTPGDDWQQATFLPLPDDGNKLENYQESYTYDESGNLVQTRHAAASHGWTRRQVIRPDSNRLQSIATGDAAQDVGYDPAGNQRQLDIYGTAGLTWSCCDTLVKVMVVPRVDARDDAEYYTYDSQDRRTRKVSERLANGGTVVAQETTTYVGDYTFAGLQSLTPKSAVSLLKRHTLRVMDDRTCVAIIHSWEQDDTHREVDQAPTRRLRYQLDDHLGSVSLEVDGDARIISYEEYLPYGGTAFQTGKSRQEVSLKAYRYSGKERDTATGLYDYGARYYAPWLGRWISPDPLGAVDGLNVYAFVGGAPSDTVDRDGTMKRTLADFLGPANNVTPVAPAELEVKAVTNETWLALSRRATEGRGVVYEHSYKVGLQTRSLSIVHTHGDFKTRAVKGGGKVRIRKHNISSSRLGGSASSFPALLATFSTQALAKAGARNALRVLKGTHLTEGLLGGVGAAAAGRQQAAVELAGEIGVSEFSRGSEAALADAAINLYRLKYGNLTKDDWADPDLGYTGAGKGGAGRLRSLATIDQVFEPYLKLLRERYDAYASGKPSRPWEAAAGAAADDDSKFASWQHHKYRKWTQRAR